MSGPTRSLRLVQLGARAPRYAFMSAMAALSAAGAASIARGSSAAPVPSPRTSVVDADAAVRGFAERYARDFLRGADVGPAPIVTAGRTTQVTWTATVGDRVMSGHRRLVTVAAATPEGLTYLAVPVTVDPRGRLSVATPPAIVGPPPETTHTLPSPEREVDDAGLRLVASRTVRHYLGRDAQDLAADLDTGASVTLPATTVRVASIDAVTWCAPGCVAVALTAADRDSRRIPLRYELRFARRAGRWLVTTVHVNPTSQEAVR